MSTDCLFDSLLSCPHTGQSNLIFLVSDSPEIVFRIERFQNKNKERQNLQNFILHLRITAHPLLSKHGGSSWIAHIRSACSQRGKWSQEIINSTDPPIYIFDANLGMYRLHMLSTSHGGFGLCDYPSPTGAVKLQDSSDILSAVRVSLHTSRPMATRSGNGLPAIVVTSPDPERFIIEIVCPRCGPCTACPAEGIQPSTSPPTSLAWSDFRKQTADRARAKPWRFRLRGGIKSLVSDRFGGT